MGEIQTADGAGGVHPVSPQEPPTPKSKSGKASGTSARRPKLNARGVPVTNWDNPGNDPNKRKHAGDSPNGEGNKLGKVPGDS